MGGTALFQLLNPLIMLVIAAGFAVVYFYDRAAHTAARFLALCYLSVTGALLIDFFRPILPVVAASYASNSLYLLAAALFTAGIARRGGRAVPLGAMALIIAVAGLASTALLFIHPDTSLRALANSLAGALIFALGLPVLRAGRASLINRILFWELAVHVTQMVLRPFFVLVLVEPGLTDAGLAGSIYAISFHFTVAVISLSVAATLFVAFGMDIVRNLHERGQIDHLSGVLNRRGFEERAAAALGRSSGDVLIVCDIDHFKRINDRHGHAVGDRVIRAFAALIANLAGGHAIVGRIGGEEFAILLPRATTSAARLMGEAVRAQLAAPREDAAIPAYTASFGVAAALPEDTLSSLMARADEALYRAKRAGRDRVMVDVPRPAAIAASG